jgi:predicted DCC family thiol-disulfide oxidoreductase YuxK
MMTRSHLLIWDGDCGFCQRVIDWVKLRDHYGRLRTQPYQLCPSPPMTPELRAKARRAVQVLASDGRHLSAGRACLFVLSEIGWHPGLVRIAGAPPFIWFVELGYAWVARNRQFVSRWFETPVCSLPKE